MGVKHAVAGTAIRFGADRMARRLRRAAVPVLAYHNVVPAASRPAGDRSLHLDFDSFRRQMDHLQRAYEVVPVTEIRRPAAVGSGRRDDDRHAARPAGRPMVAVTFDDAYRGAVRLALPELRSRGLPATVFVAPGILGSAGMWWDRLADPDRGLAATLRRHALVDECGDHERVMAWAADRGLEVRDLPEDLGIAEESELREAIAGSHTTVGAHSWAHLDLSGLSPARLDEQLVTTRDWLAGRFESWIPWLAYPYGLHSEPAARAAAATGHVGALRVDGGLVTERERPHTLPRVNVPAGVPDSVFRLMLAGLWR